MYRGKITEDSPDFVSNVSFFVLKKKKTVARRSALPICWPRNAPYETPRTKYFRIETLRTENASSEQPEKGLQGAHCGRAYAGEGGDGGDAEGKLTRAVSTSPAGRGPTVAFGYARNGRQEVT